MSYLFIKRFFDVSVAIILLVLFSPIIFLLVISLSLDMLGSPFFVQKRVGKGEVIFPMLKFRTMKGSNGELKVTRFSSMVRKLGLDELPQLLNVIKGEMSLVGPRPIPIHYLPLVRKEHRLRHLVTPGITGLAQLAINSTDWHSRFELDVQYTKELGFKTDLSILFRTFKMLIHLKKVDHQEVLQRDY